MDSVASAARPSADVLELAARRLLEGTLKGGAPYSTEAERFLVLMGWHSIEHGSTSFVQRALIYRQVQDKRQRFRLTEREFLISHLVAHGLASKEVAAKLSMSVAAVRAALGRTLQKLALTTSTQLSAFWRALAEVGARFELHQGFELFVFQCDLRTQDRRVHLTTAEQEVLRFVLNGQSNYRISATRATSVRTVANQLASVLRKFGVASRGELAAKALGLFPRNDATESLAGPVQSRVAGAGFVGAPQQRKLDQK